MKHSIFSETTKDGKSVVYYSSISGESPNGKWSNRVSTLKDRLIFTNKLAGAKVRYFVGTDRVLTKVQADFLVAVLEEGKVVTEKVVRKAGVDVDLQTNKLLTADKETVVLKSITVELSNDDIKDLLEFVKEQQIAEPAESAETLE